MQGSVDDGNSPIQRCDEKQATVKECFEEEEDECLELCANENAPFELIELIEKREISTLLQVIQYLMNHPDAHLTGYASIRDVNVCKGLFIVKDNYIQLIGSESEGCQLIVADIAQNVMIAVLRAKSIDDDMLQIDLVGVNANEVVNSNLDLDNTGRYWEGAVMKNNDDGCYIPYGYGREYNEDNNVVYEGFMLGDKRVCYGKEYRGILHKNGLVYEGGYCNGVRYGSGKSYDLNGNVEYEGKWVDNHPRGDEMPVLKNRVDLFISMSVEDLIISRKLYNEREITDLHFSPILIRLKRIEIGPKCFKHVRKCVLNGLEKLESVKIGWECFRISDYERDDGICRITNCPNLTQLEIGRAGFRDFHQIELSNVNSLQSIQFGKDSFIYTENCILKGE